jgi:hypothetical protein
VAHVTPAVMVTAAMVKIVILAKQIVVSVISAAIMLARVLKPALTVQMIVVLALRFAESR